MRELCYSQGSIVHDNVLLCTICVFFKKVWLPNWEVLDQTLAFDKEVYSPLLEEFAKGRRKISELSHEEQAELRAIALRVKGYYYREQIMEWETKYLALFKNGILERLAPVGTPVEMPGGFRLYRLPGGPGMDPSDIRRATKNPYDRDVLNYHLMRTDLPGIVLFDAGKTKKAIELAGALFHIDLPKITGSLDAVMELREVAQKKGIEQFWQMVEEHAEYALAQGQTDLARAEKIREEYKKWSQDLLQFRGKTLWLGLLTTLVWFNSAFLIPVTVGAMNWIGEANRIWIQSKQKEGRAFQWMSRVDRKLKKLRV